MVESLSLLYFSWGQSACTSLFDPLERLSERLSRELTYVLVMSPDSLLGRHAEKFILAGPILEGLVGGLSSFNGVVHA